MIILNLSPLNGIYEDGKRLQSLQLHGQEYSQEMLSVRAFFIPYMCSLFSNDDVAYALYRCTVVIGETRREAESYSNSMAMMTWHMHCTAVQSLLVRLSVRPRAIAIR